MSHLLQMSNFVQSVLTTPWTSGVAPAASPSGASSVIEWTDCAPDPSIQLKCANLSVPLDWSNPNGKQINLAIGMLPIANASQRIGYLFTNPGGPGGGPIQANGTGEFGSGNSGDEWRSSELHQYFDIVVCRSLQAPAN